MIYRINLFLELFESKECFICKEDKNRSNFTACTYCDQIICDECAEKMDNCPFCRGEFGLWKCLFCNEWFILNERINYHFCLEDYPTCIHQISYPFIPEYLCVRKTNYGRIIERIWVNSDQEIVECCECDLDF